MFNTIVDIILRNKRLIPVIIAAVAIASYLVPVNTFSATQSVKADGYGGSAGDDNGHKNNNNGDNGHKNNNNGDNGHKNNNNGDNGHKNNNND